MGLLSVSGSPTLTYEEMLALLAQRENEAKEWREKCEEERKKNITGFADLMNTEEIKASLLVRAEGIYDKISVRQIEHKFGGDNEASPARKFTLERSWSFRDLNFVGPLCDILWNPDSVYARTIDTDAILRFLLFSQEDRRVKLDVTYQLAVKLFKKQMGSGDVDKKLENLEKLGATSSTSFAAIKLPTLSISSSGINEEKTISSFQFALEQIVKNGSDFKQHDIYKEIKEEADKQNFEIFLKGYQAIHKISCVPVRDQLWRAYWQQQSIVIIVPNNANSQSFIELKTNGIANSIFIALGKFLVGDRNKELLEL